jgi:hypothetical protein
VRSRQDKYLNIFDTALKSYRILRPASTNDGIPAHDEITEYLKEDARILGLAAPLPATGVFDFPYSAN